MKQLPLRILSLLADCDQPITSHYNIGASKHETRLNKTINKEIDTPIPDILPNSQKESLDKQ